MNRLVLGRCYLYFTIFQKKLKPAEFDIVMAIIFLTGTQIVLEQTICIFVDLQKDKLLLS